MEQDARNKLSHASVHYIGVSPHPKRECRWCVHFIAADPPRCESVQAPIAARGWCQRFENIAQKSGMRGSGIAV